MSNYRLRALCASDDPTYWDDDGKAGRKSRIPSAQVAYAKSVCARCPVSGQCLRDAVVSGDVWTIRGALTAAERRDKNLHPDWDQRRSNFGYISGSGQLLDEDRANRVSIAQRYRRHGLTNDEIAEAMNTTRREVIGWIGHKQDVPWSIVALGLERKRNRGPRAD